MNAIFKSDKRLLITGSDRDERLLLKNFLSALADESLKIEAKSLVDINGDETGISIELVEVTENIENQEP